MPTNNNFCRISGFIARKANKAIILRRGPSRLFQMLLWDLKDDQITSGQWLKAKVEADTVVVSDDAQFVAYEAYDYKEVSNRDKSSIKRWIAVSRPPYFTAIGMWESTGYIFEPPAKSETNLKHTKLTPEVLNLANRITHDRFEAALASQGWHLTFDASETDWKNRYRSRVQTISLQKNFGNATARYQIFMNKSHQMIRIVTLVDSSAHTFLTLEPGPDKPLWIDVDNSGRLVYADQGCLYAWRDFPNGEPQLIADLNPNKFENIPPPDWALKP